MCTRTSSKRLILDLKPFGWDIFDELGRYQYQSIQEVLPTHAHTGMIEICFLAKGEQSYYVYNDLYKVKGSELFVTFPDEVHGTGDLPENKGILYWMVIKPPTPQSNFLDLPYDQASCLYNLLLTIPSRLFKGDKECENLLQQVFELGTQPATSPWIRMKLANTLTGWLLHILELAVIPLTSQTDKRVEQVLEYIHKNVADNLDLVALAASVQLSLSRFMHLFKTEIGMPPMEYILQQKVEKAKQSIETGTPIKEIAYDLSFSSPSYFSRVFKQYSGMSPSQYKKSLAE